MEFKKFKNKALAILGGILLLSCVFVLLRQMGISGDSEPTTSAALFPDCTVSVDLDPKPSNDPHYRVFAFHTTEVNESKTLNVTYLDVHLSLKWKGTTFTGELNGLRPAAGETVGQDLNVFVDSNHPITHSSRPIITSFVLDGLTIENATTGETHHLRPDQCNVALLVGGKRLH